MRLDVAIRGGLLCDADTPPRPGQVGIRDGRIAVLASQDADLDAAEVIDADGCVVIPGLLDPHVHLGHGAEHASEFWTEGNSALVGGVTTLLTFYRRDPFNYLDLIPDLIAAGEGNCPVDFLVHLPLYTGTNLEEIPSYHDRLGVRGFKFFPGIRGDDAARMTRLPHTGPMLPIDDYFVYDGMSRVSELGGAVALYHAENPDINAAFANRIRAEGRNDLAAWCDSRPDFGEAQSVEEALYWQRTTGCPLYVVHVSSARALEVLAEDRRRRPHAPVYVESCPQFLTHTRDSSVGTLAKMSPPMRTPADQDRLWQAIRDREIDTIGSDHGAFMRADKQDAWNSRSGFPGMATILPALVTYGVRPGRITMQDLVRVCAASTARIFGIDDRKGSLRVGADADLAVVDLEGSRTVSAADLKSRSDFSIYEGQTLFGWPVHVMRRGAVLLRDGDLTTDTPGGGVYLGWRAAR